jgi:hypothetical protein
MPTSAPNTDISQRADVGIGPYGASLNNNLSQQKGEPWRIRHGSYKEEENEETNDQTS